MNNEFQNNMNEAQHVKRLKLTHYEQRISEQYERGSV